MNNALITIVASLFIWIMFAGLVVLWIIDGRIKQEQAMHAFLGSVFVFVLTSMIKYLVPVPRPFVVNGAEVLTITTKYDNSFPSTHTAIAFTIAVIIYLHDKRIGILFLICALMIGAARVLANVHYPLDILGGAIIGATTALTLENIHAFRLIKKITKRS